MFKPLRAFYLCLFSGLLLSISWFWNLGIITFFAWVPLLILEGSLSVSHEVPKRKLRLFLYSYCTFFSWNLLVTWWIVYASFGGACMAILANALLMTVVFLFYSDVKNRIGKNWATWLLIPIWLAWEYLHSLWDLSWIWLNLGNVFSFHHNWVQWYEFTGSSGGTVWVLAVNLLVYQTIIEGKKFRIISSTFLKILASIVSPILFSYLIYMLRSNPKRESQPVKTLVVQPNIDPYNAKFITEYPEQFKKFLVLIKGKVTADTKYLILPETFITENLNEVSLNNSEEIGWFRESLMREFPRLEIITGGNTYTFFENEKDVTATSRKDDYSGKYYDVFNSAIYITDTSTTVYHKSKLVPGVERMPFPALFKPLEKLALDMGGTVGSLGTQDNRGVFNNEKEKICIAPVICYESIYSDYLTGYIRAGANLIVIITNDGWWENTPGYKQHLNFARLRAIENRRQIVRCANTGISCFIDELGNTYQNTNWWEEAVIERDVYTNDQLTFFTRFGDQISYISVIVLIVLLLWSISRRWIFRKV